MVAVEQKSKSSPDAINNRNRRLLDCYQRGIHLARCEKDYDYAHAMFAECVLHDPGNLQFVESMVQNLRAKTPHVKRSRFKFRRGGSRTLKKALHRKDWTAVVRSGIELLETDPWDVNTLRAIAEACAVFHYNEVELIYLKQALDAEPKNIEVSRHCARSLGRMGQFDQAIACWHRVEKLAGKDAEATRMISVLAEEKLKYPNGRPPAANSKQTAVDLEISEAEDTVKELVLRPEQKLEQAISLDPQNIDNYINLAELLIGSNRFSAAEIVLRRAIAACGEREPLMEQLQRIRYLLAEEQRRLAEERAIDRQIANAPVRIPWMELGFGTAILLLVLQLVPSAGAAVWTLIDFHRWSRFGWFVVSIIVLLGLIGARFVPECQTNIRRNRLRQRYRSQHGIE